MNAGTRFGFAARSAGTGQRRARSPHETAVVKASTRKLRCTSRRSGSGVFDAIATRLQHPRARAADRDCHRGTDSSNDSTNSCRTSRSAPGAERDTQRHLARTHGRARQQKIGDVRARYQQDHPDDRHQQVQRRTMRSRTGDSRDPLRRCPAGFAALPCETRDFAASRRSRARSW